ncbi:MAG: glutamate racemase [Christensenellales bacterium]
MKGSILLIDSGAGGISTLKVLRKVLPYEDYIYYADNKNMPYGNKSRAFLAENASEIIKKVSEDYSLKMIVLACNTLTGAAVASLRDEFAALPIVGMEPAYKPAGERGGKTAVLCTAVTGETLSLNSKLYGLDAKTVVLPELAMLIEHGAPDEEIISYVKKYVDEGEFSNIVLGCTHYCLKRRLFEETFPDAAVFDGNSGVARRVKELLEKSGSLNDRHFVPSTVLVLSRPERSEINRYVKLLRAPD